MKSQDQPRFLLRVKGIQMGNEEKVAKNTSEERWLASKHIFGCYEYFFILF